MKQRKKLKERNYKERQKNLTSDISKLTSKSKGITLIALVITIIVLIILAGISISLVLGQNGLFNKAKGAAIETAKSRFVEDAGFAYSEAYIEKTEKSDSNNITIGDVVSKLKSSYGYTDDQIKTVTSGVSGITLSETEVTLEPGETKEVTVTLENGTYYAFIEGLYYPITLSNGEITLGIAVASLQTGDEVAKEIQATVAEESGVEVSVDGNKITIKVKQEQEEAGEATVTVTYGESISKEIKVKIKVEVKQGDKVPLGDISVQVNGSPITLAHEWKYFYNDIANNKVWLIYNGILEGVAQQVSGTIELIENNNVHSSSNRDDLISYLNGTGNYTGKWDHIKAGIKEALDTKKITVQDSEIEVKGSPDIELFQKAYDQMYPTEKFEVKNNGTGYQYRFGGTGDFKNDVSVSNYSSKTLFFIGSNYWLASPGAYYNKYCLCGVYGTNFTYGQYSNNITGARPVVSIPTSAFNQLIS